MICTTGNTTILNYVLRRNGELLQVAEGTLAGAGLRFPTGAVLVDMCGKVYVVYLLEGEIHVFDMEVGGTILELPITNAHDEKVNVLVTGLNQITVGVGEETFCITITPSGLLQLEEVGRIPVFEIINSVTYFCDDGKVVVCASAKAPTGNVIIFKSGEDVWRFLPTPSEEGKAHVSTNVHGTVVCTTIKEVEITHYVLSGMGWTELNTVPRSPGSALIPINRL